MGQAPGSVWAVGVQCLRPVGLSSFVQAPLAMAITFGITQSTMNVLWGKGLSRFGRGLIEHETLVVDPACIHLELGVLGSKLGKGSSSPRPTTSSEVELMETNGRIDVFLLDVTQQLLRKSN